MAYNNLKCSKSQVSKKNNPPGCKSLSSIRCLRKANIPLQKFVFSGNDEKRDSKENFYVQCSQKGICFKDGDYSGKIETQNQLLLSPEDSNYIDESQSSTKQRNCVLSCLNPNNKSRLFQKDFDDTGLSPETMRKVVLTNLFKLLFKLMTLFSCKLN